MQFAKILSLAAVPLAMAAPTEKRAALSMMDISVLQLAHYLENLEYHLYTGGFSNFTEEQYQAAGFPAGFRENVGVTASVGQSLSLHDQSVAYCHC